MGEFIWDNYNEFRKRVGKKTVMGKLDQDRSTESEYGRTINNDDNTSVYSMNERIVLAKEFLSIDNMSAADALFQRN